MNLPIGDVIEQNLNLREFDAKGTVSGLFDRMFSGYVVATIDGFDGMEEGVLLFKKGSIVGSIYEYTNYGIVVFGEPAMVQTINSMAAPWGVADVYSLSTQQVDLVTAFNDKIKITKDIQKRDIAGLFGKPFSDQYARQVLGEVLKQHESRETVFKKLGLSRLG